MQLHTTLQEKAYYLRQAVWLPDTPGMFDMIGKDEKDAANEGFVDRAAFIQKSVPLHILDKVLPDFRFQQLLPDQTEIFIRTHCALSSSCLLAKTNDYKIEISQARNATTVTRRSVTSSTQW